jgi:acetylornithine deacetylase/succinyl-diaminopimelate desuccinylase-like protein
MTPEIISLMDDVAKELWIYIPHIPIVSGEGHDTMNIAAITDVGMVFIRCREGLSHNPGEYAAIDDIMAGANVLTETLHRLAF